MKAIVVDDPGGADQMSLLDIPKPVCGNTDLLIRVYASALNRADIIQREGHYPAQHGASEIMGLELAGEVIELGSDVTKFNVGDRVYGLSGGGGYAEIATLHQDLAMLIPDSFNYQYAASIPEVFFTANTVIRTLGKVQSGERVLIHAGGSGVGIAATQIAKLLGAEVWVTVGSDEKCSRALTLDSGVGGADVAINYNTKNFVDEVIKRTLGVGVHLILDVVGASYLKSNVSCLSEEGKLIIVGLMSGAKAEIDLGRLLRDRIQVIGTVMRSRSHSDRVAMTRDFQKNIEPKLIDGRLKSVIDCVFPLREAAEAHRYMESNRNFGKIILDIAN